jgi:hypothetical protein
MPFLEQVQNILESQASTGDVAFTNFNVSANSLFFEDECTTVLIELDPDNNENIVVKYATKENGNINTFTYTAEDQFADTDDFVSCMLNDFYDISMDDDDFE